MRNIRSYRDRSKGKNFSQRAHVQYHIETYQKTTEGIRYPTHEKVIMDAIKLNCEDLKNRIILERLIRPEESASLHQKSMSHINVTIKMFQEEPKAKIFMGY